MISTKLNTSISSKLGISTIKSLKKSNILNSGKQKSKLLNDLNKENYDYSNNKF